MIVSESGGKAVIDPESKYDPNTPGAYPIRFTITSPEGAKVTKTAVLVVNLRPVPENPVPDYTGIPLLPGSNADSPQLNGKVPEGTEYALGAIPEGWKATIDPKTGAITATSPADAKPGTTVVIPMNVTYPDGSTGTTSAVFTVIPPAKDGKDGKDGQCGPCSNGNSLGSISGSLGGSGSLSGDSLGNLGSLQGNNNALVAGSLALGSLGLGAIAGGALIWAVQNGLIFVPPQLAALIPAPMLGSLGIAPGNREERAPLPPAPGPSEQNGRG